MTDTMTDKMTEEQKELASKNVGLMYSFIKGRNGSGVVPYHLRDDFISDIGMGFCRSAMGFDEKKGFKFSTYAYGAFDYGCIRIITVKEKNTEEIILLILML